MKQKKEKLSKEEKQRKKCQKCYDELKDRFNLENLSVIEQVHVLVDQADSLMGEICAMSDDIKINDLAKAQQFTPIDKKTYLDFVYVCARKNDDKLKEKAIDQFEEDVNKRLFITNLRYSFLTSYMSGKDIKITDENNEEFKPFTDYNSQEFDNIMQDSAKKRLYLNTILWPKYKTFGLAAIYATNMEMTYKDFKNLVDYQHYINGGYPSPTTPSKIWSIFDKFNYAYRLLDKWGYDDTKQGHNKEFGLDVKLNTPYPIEHAWMKTKEELD